MRSILFLSVLLFADRSCAVAVAPVDYAKTDLLIVGATESGWAAAIQAARMGVGSITIVHDGKWVGGQFTEQSLACVDENKGVGKVGWGVDWHPMKRSFHRSGLFKELMDRIEALNALKYGSPMPGRPYHGPSTFRPVEAEAVFRDMLRPYIESGQIEMIFDHKPISADVKMVAGRPRLTGLAFAPLGSNDADVHFDAPLTIDASDWGDAIQLSGAAFECGPDPKSRYGEPSAPDELSDTPPNEMNPITWAMIVEQADRESPIEIPERFDDRNFVRTSKLSLGEMRDLDWDRPVRLSSILHWPKAGTESPRQLSVYTVRRLVDGRTSKTGKTLILLNYMLGQDYPLERLPKHVVDALEATEVGASTKDIVRMSRAQRQIIFDDARRHSLAMFYHLQHYVHERADDTANSFRSFRLSDEFGTDDRLPPKPYIRESLRLKAMYMMREQDGRNRDGKNKDLARERFAEVMYPDGVMCWQFHYDFHRTGRAYLQSEGNAGPWIDFEKPDRHTHHLSDRSVFPLRSLIPEQMDGLLGAQKNVGYSSIVCAAIRLHDQCIAIGQAAGATAAVALRENISPRQIPFDREQLEQVRDGLCGGTDEGVPLLLWPFRDLSIDHDAFVAISRLSAIGIVVAEQEEVDFEPNAMANESWQDKAISRAKSVCKDDFAFSAQAGLTRGDFCRHLWHEVESQRLLPFTKANETDFDEDGIRNQQDPIPFTAAPVVTWSIRAAKPAGPAEDGILDDGNTPAKATLYNFAPRGSAGVQGFVHDAGEVFDAEKGYGWESSLVESSRRRGVFPDQARDTFLFTRQRASWEVAIPDGGYLVTVCVGDAGHPQHGQRVKIEGVRVVDNVSTAAERFSEITATVEVNDGRLTMELGPQTPGHNTCVNWLRVERK